MFTFNRRLPEEVGVSSASIRKILEVLDKKEIPMHSLLIMKGDKLIFEKYYAPYTENTLHRLFSISKTITAIALSTLANEKGIDLDSSICDFFPEYVTQKTHHWIKETTLKNMLQMRTCHASTTYKVDMKSDWVESFFTVPPTHKPGTIFHYDTSAAHVLCALVEKETGMDMLSYLKKKVLDYMDFSEASYMLKDPFGVSIGGSGLMATPMDFLKILYLIEKRGKIICNDGCERTLLSKEFFDEATSNISDSLFTAPLPSEAQGYGMQIWQNEKGGYVLYGMGGQFGISIPHKELLIVTTADTQGMQGANQVIYNTLYDNLLSDEVISPDSGKKDYDELMAYSNSLRIAPPRLPENYGYTGTGASDKDKEIHKTFKLDANKQGFEELTACVNAGSGNISTLTIKVDKARYHVDELVINFGLNSMKEGIFPIYDNAYTAGGIWTRDNVLYIKVSLIGESVGSIKFQLYFGDDDLVVFMKKIEETYYKEFEGHLYGKAI